MHAVIGRVTIKPGREDETLAMVRKGGVAMLSGMSGGQQLLGLSRKAASDARRCAGSHHR